MIDTDKYEGEDWLVRYYNHDDKYGDGMDYDNLEEALEAFKVGVKEEPKLEWTLYHYYNYKPNGEGGWHEPIEDTIMHWNGEEIYEYKPEYICLGYEGCTDSRATIFDEDGSGIGGWIDCSQQRGSKSISMQNWCRACIEYYGDEEE